MNIEEAYKLLEVDKSISDDDLKVHYKKLAVKYHPDVNKTEPDKFKSINEAFQLVQDYRTNPDKYERQSFSRSPFDNFGGISINDLFNNHFGNQQQKSFQYQPLTIYNKISFKESVLGINKDIKFKKYIKCESCNGRGSEPLKNNCNACDGFGRIISNNNGMIFTRSCNRCHGKDVKTKSCNKCSSVGVSEAEINLTIHIPPGTLDNSTLRLRGAGHYVGSNMFGDAYTDVYVYINVIPEDGLTLEGSNVVSRLNISLLEALTGCQKDIKTIYDNRMIDIQPNSKNKDEIKIPGCGVANGNQRVILEIIYPDNTESLIKFLKRKQN